MPEKIIVGSDHAGIVLRGEAARVAAEAGFEVEDVGSKPGERVDYPD